MVTLGVEHSTNRTNRVIKVDIPGHEIMSVINLGLDVLIIVGIVWGLLALHKSRDRILHKVRELTSLVHTDLLRRSPHEDDHKDN